MLADRFYFLLESSNLKIQKKWQVTYIETTKAGKSGMKETKMHTSYTVQGDCKIFSDGNRRKNYIRNFQKALSGNSSGNY